MGRLGDWLQDKVDDVKASLQNAGAAVQNVAAAAKFAPLIPFKQVMKNAVQRKGIPVGNTLPEIVYKFKTYVIEKKSNYEEESYGAELQYVEEDGGEGFITLLGGAGAIGGIVNFLLSWFRKKQEEKDAGKPLSAEDSQTLAEANQAAAQVPTDGGTMQGKNWMVWAGVALAVILVIYFVSRKK